MARVPYFALWVSVTYLVAALGVTGKQCLDAVRRLHAGAAEASGPFSTMSPSWVIVTADAILERLWWLLASVALGVLLVAMSAVWVGTSGKGRPAAAQDRGEVS